MTNLSDLTERQIAVAALVGRGYTTKRIASDLSISCGRVRVLITSVAYRIGADPQRDERIQVALWWQTQTGAREDAA